MSNDMSADIGEGYFIAGTDTGVGKTFIASALVRHFAQRGLKSVGMKPVAAGCELVAGQLVSEDVVQLMSAGNITAPLRTINPYAFAPAIAPHIAAHAEGTDIELAVIHQAYTRLCSMAEMVIVEGVGGFRVPLGDSIDTADLAQQLALPVILVVGMRLGCISHALLTVDAIQARGLTLAGWVANTLEPRMDVLEDNIRALQQRIPAPCLAVVGWDGTPDFGALNS